MGCFGDTRRIKNKKERGLGTVGNWKNGRSTATEKVLQHMSDTKYTTKRSPTTKRWDHSLSTAFTTMSRIDDMFTKRWDSIPTLSNDEIIVKKISLCSGSTDGDRSHYKNLTY